VFDSSASAAACPSCTLYRRPSATTGQQFAQGAECVHNPRVPVGRARRPPLALAASARRAAPGDPRWPCCNGKAIENLRELLTSPLDPMVGQRPLRIACYRCRAWPPRPIAGDRPNPATARTRRADGEGLGRPGAPTVPLLQTLRRPPLASGVSSASGAPLVGSGGPAPWIRGDGRENGHSRGVLVQFGWPWGSTCCAISRLAITVQNRGSGRERHGVPPTAAKAVRSSGNVSERAAPHWVRARCPLWVATSLGCNFPGLQYLWVTPPRYVVFISRSSSRLCLTYRMGILEAGLRCERILRSMVDVASLRDM